MRALSTIGVLGVLIVGLNVFSDQLNALFLRYPGFDKGLHFVGYLAVYLAVYWAVNHTSWRHARGAVAAVITLALSLADESFQGLSASRSVEAFDVVANASAIALGWTLVRRRVDALASVTVAAAIIAACYVGWSTYHELIDYSRALQYEQQRDFVQARVHFRRALDNGLRTPALFNELGWVEIESGVGDPAQAVEYASTALHMQPTNPDILDTYGWALLHAGRTAEAVDALQRAYDANPDMYCVNYHLGAAYLATGNPELAERHFRRQVEMVGTREAAFAAQALTQMASAR